MVRNPVLEAVDPTPQHDDRSVLGRVVSLLACFGSASEPLTITALGAQTGLPPATVHRLIAKLVDSGLLERSARGRYELGEWAWQLGRGVRKTSRMRESVRPILVDLHVALSCQVLLLGRTPEGVVVVIDQIAGSRTWIHRPVDRTLRVAAEEILAAFHSSDDRAGRPPSGQNRDEAGTDFQVRQRLAMIRRQRMLTAAREDGGTWMAAPVQPSGSGMPTVVALGLREAAPASLHHARRCLLMAVHNAAAAAARGGDDR